MEFINNFLTAIDIFKCPMNLFFLSKQKISTPVNAVLSLLIYSLVIVFFLNSDYWNKKNPQISDQILDSGQTSFPINNGNYGVYFSFYDSNENFYSSLDPSCIQIEVWQSFYSSFSDDVIHQENFSLENCLIDDSSAFCLKSNWNVFLNIGKDMWNGNYSYFQFNIKYCNNETSGIVCSPLEKIKQYLDGMLFSINFLEYNFDMKSLENPVTKTYNYKEWILNQDVYQYYAYSLMQVELYEDESSFYNKNEVIFGTYLQEDPKTYFQFYNNYNGNNAAFNETLFNLEIYPSRNKREIIRKYQKLTEAISSLGGMATSLRFLFGILADFSIKMVMLKMITLNLYIRKKRQIKFNVDITNYEKNKSGKDSIEDENKIHQINDSNSFRAIYGRNIKDIELELQRDPEKNEAPPPLHIDLKLRADENKTNMIENEINLQKNQDDEEITSLAKCDFVKYVFRKLFRCKLNKNDLFIERSGERFQNDFDFVDILRKLMDLGKLKLILFNEKQREMFNSIENFNESSNANKLIEDRILLKDVKKRENDVLETSLIYKRLGKLYDLYSNI